MVAACPRHLRAIRLPPIQSASAGVQDRPLIKLVFIFHSKIQTDQVFRQGLGRTIRTLESSIKRNCSIVRRLASLRKPQYRLLAYRVAARQQHRRVVGGGLLLEDRTAKHRMKAVILLELNLDLCMNKCCAATGSSSCWLHSSPLLPFSSDSTLKTFGKASDPTLMLPTCRRIIVPLI